ncbi:MAG: 3-deoxy-manno-octulosonate cytidylyltransferase [Gammaproteobacteria bacterium]|nr:3-deoxy-manno-octulosonate cytidylyltransferase [Gammaproteobacteria bacterium]
MAFRIVIPARYASVRLPGKPLREIGGKPMLQHVYEKACCSSADEIIIATDDQRIYDIASTFANKVCMTSDQHTSGTERLAEVAQQYNFADNDIIVNLQGDEPLMPESCIEQVADALHQNKEAQIATLCTAIDSIEDVFDPNIVKVVRDSKDFALYFSRAPIPWYRGKFDQTPAQMPDEAHLHYRHIGLYAYRAAYIRNYINSDKTLLENAESLEQLRALWHGDRIIVPVANDIPGPGVDTEEDLQKVSVLIAG